MVDRFGNPEDRPGLFDLDRTELTHVYDQLCAIDGLDAWIERQDDDDALMRSAVIVATGARDTITAAAGLLRAAIDAIPPG